MGLCRFYEEGDFAESDMRSESARDLSPEQSAWNAAVLAAMNFVPIWQDSAHGDMDPTELLALLSHELPGDDRPKLHRPPDPDRKNPNESL